MVINSAINPVNPLNHQPASQDEAFRKREPSDASQDEFERLMSVDSGSATSSESSETLEGNLSEDNPKATDEMTEKEVSDWSIEMSVNAIFNNRIEVEKEQW